MTPETKARGALLAVKEYYLMLCARLGISLDTVDYIDEPHQDAAWEAAGGVVIVTAIRIDNDPSDDPQKAVYRLLVGERVVIPGCHTMPNGDPGYPPEEDLVDVESFQTTEIAKCAICAFETTTKLLVQDVVAGFQEDMMFKEFEDDSDGRDDRGDETSGEGSVVP